MTSNFRISYPDIPYRGSVYSSSTAATGYDSKYLWSGPRSEYFKRSTAGTTIQFAIDMGSATAQPDHLIVARADLLRKADSAAVSWSVQGAVDSGFTVPETKTGTFELTDLLGPKQEDLLREFTFSTAYRYFRVLLVTTDSIQGQLSKIYLGNFLDLGIEPLYSSRFERLQEAKSDRDAGYRFSLQWSGISNASRSTLINSVLTYSDLNPIFIYETSDDLLNDNNLMHASIEESRVTPVNHINNEVSLTLRELI